MLNNKNIKFTKKNEIKIKIKPNNTEQKQYSNIWSVIDLINCSLNRKRSKVFTKGKCITIEYK